MLWKLSYPQYIEQNSLTRQSSIRARVPLAYEELFHVAVEIIPEVIGVDVELHTVLILVSRRFFGGPVGKGTQVLSSGVPVEVTLQVQVRSRYPKRLRQGCAWLNKY